MHVTQVLVTLLSTAYLISASTIPSDTNVLALRSPIAHEGKYWETDLEKRRGGGGGGRGGTSSGGTSSGGSRAGGTGGTSGSTSGSRSPTSNIGGTSSGGSGVRPGYGGRYAGGATTPYSAGSRSPGGILPGLLVGSALGFWLVSSASWGPYGAYEYRFPANITFTNQTSGVTESLPGICLCSRYQSCSCSAESTNGTYINALIGDGSYAYQQSHMTLFQVDDVDGKRTLAINGTLANGTTAAATNAASFGKTISVQNAGWLGLVTIIGSAILLL